MKLTATLLLYFRNFLRSGTTAKSFSRIWRLGTRLVWTCLRSEDRTNSVLIDEVSKMEGSLRCVNQQTGYDLHRIVDARKAVEWAIEHRPRVTWFRKYCCCWDSESNETTLSGRQPRKAFDPKLHGSHAYLMLPWVMLDARLYRLHCRSGHCSNKVTCGQVEM